MFPEQIGLFLLTLIVGVVADTCFVYENPADMYPRIKDIVFCDRSYQKCCHDTGCCDIIKTVKTASKSHRDSHLWWLFLLFLGLLSLISIIICKKRCLSNPFDDATNHITNITRRRVDDTHSRSPQVSLILIPSQPQIPSAPNMRSDSHGPVTPPPSYEDVMAGLLHKNATPTAPST